MADSDAALSAATLRALLIAKSRGAVRQLLSMVPNLRPAAAFSPHKTRGAKPSSTTIRSLSMAGSVVAGALLFSGHDGALQWVRSGNAGETARSLAPPVQAAACGAFGGLLHAAVAKPVEMRVRAGPDTATPMLSQIRHYLSPPGRAELFRGFRIAALRDVFGFAAYFAAFVAVRDFCRGAVMEHLSESSSAGGAGQTLRPHPPSLRAELPPGYEIGCAAFGGAAAGVAGYCVRSPFNTLYKVGTGHRDGSARLLSLQRFASSPRGARAVVTGSLTFVMYEVVLMYARNAVDLKYELKDRKGFGY